MSELITNINNAFGSSLLGKFFKVNERGSTFTRELNGALATFMSMAYILAVNPRLLAESGGPCVPDPEDMGGIFGPNYSACLEDVKREFITATAIASMFGCVLMGLLANLPIALAPGMGMNAYFAYSVVGFRGTGGISYDAAITAVLIEGFIFLFLSVTGLRYALVKLIPEPVRVATPAAIGAFLAHLGLQTAEGIGAVVGDVATAVTLGACPPEKRTYFAALTEDCLANTAFCVTSDNYTCDDLGGVMTSGRTWIGMLGLVIIVTMLAYKQNSAFVVAISFVTVLSWFRGTEISYFPHDEAGDARFEYFKQVVRIESLDLVTANFSNNLKDAGVALFTFLYVDLLDTSGTLLALVSAMGLVDENGDFENSNKAFAVDALATIFGSIFGLSPVTSYIESGAGVEAGARTGLAAIFCGFFFFLSIFFAPIIASIPPWAVGGSLIVVGSLMARSLDGIKWHDPVDAATAFITLIVMPLTYSIAYGLIAGIGVWVCMNACFKFLELAFGIERPVFEKASPISIVKEGEGEGAEPPIKEIEEVDEIHL